MKLKRKKLQFRIWEKNQMRQKEWLESFDHQRDRKGRKLRSEKRSQKKNSKKKKKILYVFIPFVEC